MWKKALSGVHSCHLVAGWTFGPGTAVLTQLPFKVLWGHWDVGEEPSQKMESPPGSPLPVGRLTRPEKGQLCALPAFPTPPFILPDSSVSVPRLGFLPTHQPSGPQTQCCVPLSARPWHLRPCCGMTHLT